MSISTYRHLIIQTIIVLITGLVSCQSIVSDKKTDSVTKLAIHYLNANRPDSFYKLTGEGFRKHITSTLSASIYKEKIAGLLPLTNLTFITKNDSASVYKVDGKIPLNCYISLDKQNKLNKFNFLPYQKENFLWWRCCPWNPASWNLGRWSRQMLWSIDWRPCRHK